jgi:hypothetical protein
LFALIKGFTSFPWKHGKKKTRRVYARIITLDVSLNGRILCNYFTPMFCDISYILWYFPNFLQILLLQILLLFYKYYYCINRKIIHVSVINQPKDGLWKELSPKLECPQKCIRIFTAGLNSVCVCMCVCMREKKREQERERDKQTQRDKERALCTFFICCNTPYEM